MLLIFVPHNHRGSATKALNKQHRLSAREPIQSQPEHESVQGRAESLSPSLLAVTSGAERWAPQGNDAWRATRCEKERNYVL